MCIAFPAKIFKIEDNMAMVEIEGTVKRVSLDLIDEEVSLGDYVISHAGFAIQKLDERAAEERIDLLREIMRLEEERTGGG